VTGEAITRTIGGYEVTFVPGVLRRAGIGGRVVRVTAPPGEPCIHVVTPGQARELAEVLLDVAGGY
jgi:hypothetical protein